MSASSTSSSSTGESSPGGPSVDLEGPRAAAVEERDELLTMINHIFRVSRDWAPTIATDWAHVYARENLNNVMVVCDRAAVSEDGATQGKIVASTGVWASDVMVEQGLVRVGGINCVGTLPEYRRHGLGSQVMAAAAQRMAALNCHIGLLSTGIADWYRRLEWEEAGMQRVYRLNRGNIALLPAPRPGLNFRLVELETPDETQAKSDLPAVELDAQVAAEVMRLQSSARIGAVRDRSGFCRRAAARRMQRLALLEEGAAVAAYLLLKDSMIMEWGGAPEDVMALLQTCFHTLDDAQASTSQRGGHNPTLLVQTPGWAHPLTARLDQIGIPFRMEYLGMILLLEPQAVLDACGIDGVRVEPVNGDYLVVAGNRRVTLDRRQLTKHFFGPERISDVGAQFFPLHFWQWGLEMV